MPNSPVAIIVLNWNSIEQTLTCITSLKKQTYKNSTLIVVDNGSTQKNTAAQLAALENSGCVILKNSSNLGFAGGVNTGLAYALDARFEHVALINNDARADKKWLISLLHVMESNEEIGITTGLFLNEKGDSIDSTGEQYSKWGLPFPRDRNLSRADAPGGSEVFGATGGASLYSVKMLREIGLFDEDFFAYYEDVDISFRAQLAGWKIHYTSDAIAYHKRGQTSAKISGLTTKMHFQNLLFVFLRNVPATLMVHMLPRFLFAYIAMLTKAILRGDSRHALSGLTAALKKTPKKLGERRIIQSKKDVTNNYITSMLFDSLPPKK